jgi:hypothetical protein
LFCGKDFALSKAPRLQLPAESSELTEQLDEDCKDYEDYKVQSPMESPIISNLRSPHADHESGPLEQPAVLSKLCDAVVPQFP